VYCINVADLLIHVVPAHTLDIHTCTTTIFVPQGTISMYTKLVLWSQVYPSVGTDPHGLRTYVCRCTQNF